MFKQFNFFSKTFLFFFSIICFLILISFLSTQYFLYFLEKRIEERTLAELNLLGEQIDSVLTDAYKTACDYIWDESLDNIRNSDNILKDFFNGHSYLGQKAESYLHSIYYIDNKNNIVIEKNGYVNQSTFFKLHYPNINKDDIAILSSNSFTFLPRLTRFNINSISYTYVMPFMLKDKNDNDNFILVNISEQKIFELLKSYTKLRNIHLFIMDSYGSIRSDTNRKHVYRPYLYPPIRDNDFILKIKTGKPFYSKYFGDKRLIIHYDSKHSTIQKLYYVSALPMKELFKQSIPLSLIAVLISFLSLLFSIILSIFMSARLYSPIKALVTLFGKNKTQEINMKNEFSFIRQNINELFKEKNILEQKLTKTLPIVKENYLFKLLNQNENFIEEEKLNNFFKNNEMSFEYQNFIVAIVIQNFNNDFYEKFNKAQQIHILNETYKLFKNAFYDPCKAYILNIDKNELCIIINFPDYYQIKDIIKSIKNVHDVFKTKENFLDIYSGIGNLHKGIIGIKKSYNEALKTVSTISPFDSDNIKIYDNKIIENISYNYTLTDENKLLNYMLGNYLEKTMEHFDYICQKNIMQKISILNQKDLYLQIYHTCLRALNRLDISPEQIMHDDFIDIPQEYRHMDLEVFQKYLISFIKKITCISKNNHNNKINSIINYINKNFHKDISLECIANEFRVSASHLSRLLKIALKMSFQNYINTQRIKKAKHLLKETNKKIDEIFFDCGFNSRFTFIKMFKKLEGITPTQFRNISNESILKNKIC